ncbi:exonuclease [Aspergillus homomorphus CBS 101889]|uniref:Exonuclease n=1 Tax=Aspergillus homomorphus (strain CBS 101889) TaxID=1450537 RepID=A0A395HPM3_ASPHC|nr:exonuclease [Aspergillus homomorphus CBS 101889]RAL09373.1 exonuclease [Aspergillus homomorphus CBS 101889]
MSVTHGIFDPSPGLEYTFSDPSLIFRAASLDDEPSLLIINTVGDLTGLLKGLSDLPAWPPSLFIDLEGTNLSRNGTISILQIFVSSTRKTYLVDIYTLGDKAFSHSASDGSTLRFILESPSIPKVFFDVRNDSDALFAHYGINLAGIQDLQLMELATRTFSKRFVKGLGKCIEYDAPMTPSERAKWKACKDAGRNLFAPECGGSYEVFNARPLSDEIIQYCAQDVQFLPRLWHKYDQRMTGNWRLRVEAEVKRRIILSKSVSYNGNGRHKALAPGGWA